MDYLTLLKESDLTYADVAHVLGCCELTVRNKFAGKTRITKAEHTVLDNLFKGDTDTCKTSMHNR